MEVKPGPAHLADELRRAEVFFDTHSLSIASFEEGHPCLALFAGFVLPFSHGYSSVHFSKATL